MSAYGEVEGRFARVSLLDDAAKVLRWDMETMMPAAGHAARAEQLAALAAVRHGAMTDSGLADLLAAAEDEAGLDEWRRANLREMRRLWAHANALPARLVEALAGASAAGVTAWREARARADYALLLPAFASLLRLVREAAAAEGEALGLSPYDALLDECEPGVAAADLDRLFADLEGFLPGLLERVLARQAALPAPVEVHGPFPTEVQRRLGRRFMEILGFDFAGGRLDESDHPFCNGTPGDVRITTRYADDDFTHGLMAVLHETGHAMYERGLPRAWRNQPVGRARSAGVHESQSLLVEMQVCRGREFLAFAAPLLRAAFGGEEAAFAPDNLARLLTRVERGFIRVDADEITYPLHVLLRYRLERALIDGRLEAEDLPAAWNEGMRKTLGVVPPDDRLGCLQDIHWPAGAFAYFPSYTLGAVMAAQLFDAAKREDPGIAPALARGDFAPLFAWLGRNVYALASLLDTDGLLVRATGRGLDPAVYRRHLEGRYLA